LDLFAISLQTMALRQLVKADVAKKLADRTSVPQLYRSIIKELPRVMIIYDVDMPLKEARKAVAFHFRKNGHLEDGKVIGLLLAKGYMELEETLMQWKQKTHLLRLLEPIEWQQRDTSTMTFREKFLEDLEDE
jgi:NADH dehydrogenase (ubiquinone) 1 alpha subcomplex subunit 6